MPGCRAASGGGGLSSDPTFRRGLPLFILVASKGGELELVVVVGRPVVLVGVRVYFPPSPMSLPVHCGDGAPGSRLSAKPLICSSLAVQSKAARSFCSTDTSPL